MVDHLKEARFFAHAADELDVSLSETGRRNAQLAVAHALIAIAEHMDKAVDRKEIATEQAALAGDRKTYLPQEGIDKVPGGM